MKILSKKSLIGFVTVIFLIIGVSSVFATKMLHRNTEELTTLADRIFVGVCLSAEEREISISGGGVMTCMEYTFEVLQSIKGVNSSTVVVRQFGKAKGVGSVIGMPSYESQRKYIVFLSAESELGLASPIGLGQGCFEVIQKAGGREKVMNGFNNRGLFHRMDPSSPQYSSFTDKEKSLMTATKGSLDFDRFVDLITKLSN